jgi:hypothetical protein
MKAGKAILGTRIPLTGRTLLFIPTRLTGEMSRKKRRKRYVLLISTSS